MSAADLAPALQVRAASPERADVFAALHLQAFDRAWSADELKRVMEGPCTFTLEAVPQQDAAPGDALAGPLGFIVVRAVAGEAEILTLAVDPEARRWGLGRALVQSAAATAKTLGAEAFWLEVAVDNEAAIALYAATGFEAAGRRPRYYARKGGDPVDALVMRRLLNSVAG
jgi:ribosomal-protein-alanine N-acetyltransferase